MEVLYLVLIIVAVVTVLVVSIRAIAAVLGYIFRTLFGSRQGKTPFASASVPPSVKSVTGVKGFEAISSSEQAELADLAAMARQLARFRAAGRVPAATLDELSSLVQARRQECSQSTPPLSRAADLANLLKGFPQISDSAKADALRIFEGLSPAERRSLPAPARFDLARLLAQTQRHSDSLETYEHLVIDNRSHPGCVPTAIEGARLALHAKKPGAAIRLLDLLAHRLPLEPAVANDVAELRRQALEALVPTTPVVQPAPQTPKESIAVSMAAPPPESVTMAPARGVSVAGEPQVKRIQIPEAPSPPPPPPRKPRRSLAEVFSTFMEERNIRWGELVGGLLIVCSSIALLVSLWDRLQAAPFFQFGCFVGLTSALFGVGLYTLHRWRLESTSRGVLLIAMLLVPLNMLAMSKLGLGVWGLLAQVASMAVFAGLVRQAAGVLTPDWRLWTVLAVVGNSAWYCMTPQGAAPGVLLLLGLAPVACYAVCLGRVTVSLRRQSLDAGQANRLLMTTGVATFTLGVGLGLLAVRGADRQMTLDWLSFLVAISAAPLLASGLTLIRGVVDRELAGLRTAGTAVAMLAAVLQMAAIALAWPQPGGMLLVAAIDGLALAWVGWRHKLQAAHGASVGCLTLAWWLAFHIVRGSLPLTVPHDGIAQLLSLAGATSSALCLAIWSAMLAATSELAARRGLRSVAAAHASGCLVVAGLSLQVIGVRASLDHALGLWAAALYALAGAGGLLLNARWRRTAWTFGSLILLSAAPLWALWWRAAEWTPAWASVLAGIALALATACRFGRRFAETRPWIETTYLLPASRLSHAWGPLAIALAVGASLANASAVTTFDVASQLVTSGCLCGLYLAHAWNLRLPSLTWLASALAGVGLAYVAIHQRVIEISEPWLAAALGHATWAGLLACAGGWLLRSRKVSGDAAAQRERTERIWTAPLAQSGFISSLAALVMAVVVAWREPASLAIYLTWLAALWLAAAIVLRSAVLFSAFQAVSTWAVWAWLTAWLWDQAWVAKTWSGLLDVRSVQIYGLGFGGVCLAWSALRVSLRARGVKPAILEPAWPAFDRGLHVFVVGANLAVAAACILPDVWATRAGAAFAFNSTAWLVLAVLVLGSATQLWDRWRSGQMVAAILLAVTAPVLVAGAQAAQLATSPALRWSLALCFTLGSAVVWFRETCWRKLRRLHCRLQLTAVDISTARGLLLIMAAGPVLVTSISALGLTLLDIAPPGPAAGSFFARLGSQLSLFIPLLLISLTLVGHAVRELSARYAFAAGLVANGGVTGAFLLWASSGGLNGAEVAQAWQCFTLFAALWAIAWMLARGPVLTWRGAAPRQAPSMLRSQVGMAGIGNVLLLLPALAALSLVFDEPLTLIQEAGSPLGWMTFALAAVAGGLRAWQMRERLRPEAVGLVGMAALGVVACSVARYAPATAWAYRSLMLGWSLYSLCVALVTWRAAALLGHGGASPPSGLLRAAGIWVRTAGLLGVALGLKAAMYHQGELLWAAIAIATASSAGASMALWLRREGWAFTAGLGVNVAASLVVWHFELQRGLPWNDWWWSLAQANEAASGAVALVWLAAQRRLYGPGVRGPLFVTQVALVVAGNVLLMAVPAVEMFVEPRISTALTVTQGQTGGWLAWAIGALATTLFGLYVERRSLPHLAGVSLLGLGVLVACSAASAGVTPWQAYHILALGWLLAAAAWLAVGWRLPLDRPTRTDEVWPGEHPAGAGVWLSPTGCEIWCAATALLATAVALRGAWEDPLRPWWPAGLSLAAGLLFVGLAIWRRKPSYGWNFGLLVNLACATVWLWSGPETPSGLLLTQVVGLAGGAALWALVERRAAGLRAAAAGGLLSYATVAAPGAAVLLACVVVLDVVGRLSGEPCAFSVELASAAWVTTAIAWLACLRRAGAGRLLPAVYGWGLAGAGMALSLSAGDRSAFIVHGAASLSGYAVLAGLFPVAWEWLKRSQAAAGPIDQTTKRPGWPMWHAASQAVLIALAGGASLWLGWRYDQPADRLWGAAAAWLGVLALGLMARGEPRARAQGWLSAGAWLAVAAMAESGSCWLESSGELLWLERAIAWLVAVGAMLALCGWALPRLAPATRWDDLARRNSPWLFGVAVAVLAAVLVGEFRLSEPRVGVVGLPQVAVGLVGLALAQLVATPLFFAVREDRDPLRLSLRGRTAYVYLAEALALAFCLHMRMTVPRLFELGILERYWTLIVMAVAFTGAALSELFHRRGLPVLSDPLARTAALAPLLPAVGLWFVPAHHPVAGSHVAILLMVAVFYGVWGSLKQSWWMKLLGAVAGNAAIWKLWTDLKLDFTEHPQLWLIPPAIAALVAEHLNRDRLRNEQSAALRYLTLSVIYVSSTADLFLSHVDGKLSLALLLVLMFLSIAGVLLGILLRVRSFLYLGVAFLLVDLSTMIYHATWDLGQGWVLWLSGILAGVAIIALFAVFEKRRNDLLHAMERFKEWS